MSQPIHPNQSAQLQSAPQSPLSDRQALVCRTILQIVLRILIPFAAMFMLAAVLPLTGYTVILSAGMISICALAALLFQRPGSICPPPEHPGPSVIKPNLSLPVNAIQTDAIPADRPRGILNRVNNQPANNCWANAIAQVLHQTPSILGWLCNPNTGYPFNAFRTFYENYQAAVDQNMPLAAAASSQSLREAFAELDSSISLDSNITTDADEALSALLWHMPDQMKGIMGEENGAATEYQFVELQLHVPQPDTATPSPVTLPEMIDAYCNAGSEHRIISRAPQVLKITLQRHQLAEPSMLQQFHLAQPTFVRHNRPVDAPELLTLPTEEGPIQYRMRGCLLHGGGHYTAGIDTPQRPYLCDDARVTPLGPSEWTRLKASATVLLYERVSQDQSSATPLV